MKTNFVLCWHKGANADLKSFKHKPAGELFFEYLSRISKFNPSTTHGLSEKNILKEKGDVLWLCDHGKGSQELSSEKLGQRLEQVLGSAQKRLRVVIGGPDGFSDEEVRALDPDLRWSFGPMTLPHELAAVIAAEQLYRAWSIIRGLPYHLGH